MNGALKRLAVLSLLAVGLLAGCGDDGQSSADSGSLNVVDATPAASGPTDHVVWANSEGEPTTLNPLFAPSSTEYVVLGNMCDTLLRFAANGDLVPSVADKADISDPHKIVLHIREGVKFWDGTPVTADDVVFDLNRGNDPKYSLSPWLYANVTSITKTGPQEVTIGMKRPDAVFYRFLAGPLGTVQKESFVKAAGDKIGTPSKGVMCTGPFKFTKWTPGQSIVLTRNDDWWDKQNAPLVKTLEYRFIKDESTLTSALQSGEVDGSFEVPFAGVNSLKNGSAPGKFYTGHSTYFYMLMQMRPNSIMADPKVKQALALSIDYDGFVKQVFKGYAYKARNIAGPGKFASARDAYARIWGEMPDPQRDLERAKQLIKEAGAEGKTVTMPTVSDVQTYASAVNTLADGMRRIGLKVKLQAFPYEQYQPILFDPKLSQKFDMAFESWNLDVSDPVSVYVEFGIPGGVTNIVNYSDPIVTKSVEQANQTYDVDKSAELLAPAIKQYAKTGPMIPIAWTYSRTFMGNRVTGPSTLWSWLYNSWAASPSTGAPDAKPTRLGAAGG